MPDQRPSIILVHGVGAGRAGQFLESFLINMSNLTNRSASIKASPDIANRWKHIVEVYWGDATGYRTTSIWRYVPPLPLFGFVLRFLLALAQVSSNGWSYSKSAASQPSLPATALKYFLFSVGIPSAIAFTLPLHFVLVPGDTKWALMALAALPVLLICYYLYRHDLACKIGLWVAVALIPGILLLLNSGHYGIEGWAKVSAYIVSCIQGVAFILVVISLFEILKDVILSRGALDGRSGISGVTAANPYLLKIFSLTFPFAVLGGGFGSLGWALNLWAARQFGAEIEDFRTWSNAYQGALAYDLALMEAAFAISLFLVGLLILILGVLYATALCLFDRGADRSRPIGAMFRWGLSGILIFYLLISVLFVLLFGLNSMIFHQKEIFTLWPQLKTFSIWYINTFGWIAERSGLQIVKKSDADFDVLQIYAASAVRIVSFLPMLAPGAIVFLATAADVLFWLVRPGRGAVGGIADTCRARFCKAYKELQSEGGGVACVVAYSQGSIVAIDALMGMDSTARIVTIGSPISSLYRDFLGIELGKGSPLGMRWTNFYRPSDYIGGSISWASCEDRQLVSNFALNHLNYFVETSVMDAINREQ